METFLYHKKPLRNRASKWFHVPPNAMISRCMLIAVFNSYCGKWKAFVKLTLKYGISIAKLNGTCSDEFVTDTAIICCKQ